MRVKVPAGAPTDYAVVSDSLEPVVVNLVLSRCPVDFPSERAICTLTPYVPATSAAGRAAVYSVTLVLSPSSVFVLTCAADPFARVPLALTITLGALIGTGGGEAALVCEILSAGESSIARSLLPLFVQPTLWPLWDDALVVAPTLSVGGAFFVRSARLAANVNATALLLRAFCQQKLPNATGESTPACNVSAAAADALAVFSAVVQAWTDSGLPNATATPATFSTTLVGPQRIVLRAASRYAPAFTRDTSVTLGGVSCIVEEVSDDGAWLMFTAPTPEALCNSTTVDCGYTLLTVSNPSRELAGVARGRRTALTPASHRGASLSCPPFCPSGVGLGVPIAAPGSGGTAFVPGTIDEGGVPVPVASPPLLGSTSQGFFYAAACDASGFYVSPVLGACSNASDPESYGCAWGSGSSCQLCPVSAVCPGGARLWPRPGFWVPTESSPPSAVAACAPPSSRCSGWGILAGAAQCGPGYLPGSYLCGGCAPAYYHTDDGTCAACPVLPGFWARYSGLVYIAAAIAGVVAAFCALFRAITWALGVPGVGGLVRLLNLGIWALMVAQVKGREGM